MLIIIDQTPVCQDLPLIRGQRCHIEGKGLHFLTQHIGRDVLQIALKGFPDMGDEDVIPQAEGEPRR